MINNNVLNFNIKFSKLLNNENFSNITLEKFSSLDPINFNYINIWEYSDSYIIGCFNSKQYCFEKRLMFHIISINTLLYHFPEEAFLNNIFVQNYKTYNYVTCGPKSYINYILLHLIECEKILSENRTQLLDIYPLNKTKLFLMSFKNYIWHQLFLNKGLTPENFDELINEGLQYLNDLIHEPKQKYLNKEILMIYTNNLAIRAQRYITEFQKAYKIFNSSYLKKYNEQ